MVGSFLCCCQIFAEIQEGYNADYLDDGELGWINPCHSYGCLYWWLLCGCYGAEKRALLRKRYGIQGDAGKDIIAHICCPCCAVMQEAGEISMRGEPKFNRFGQVTVNNAGAAPPILVPSVGMSVSQSQSSGSNELGGDSLIMQPGASPVPGAPPRR